MQKYKSQSTVIPDEWDTTSSETTVYHNTNIVVLEKKGDEPQMYGYDVEEHTRAEYVEKQSEQNRADIDYIAIMAEVEL